MQRKVILDSDGAGDELQVMAVLFAQNVQVLGATCVFGNTDVDNAFRNVRSLLSFLGHAEVPVYKGAAQPSDSEKLVGDNAHGADGVGGIELPESQAPKESMSAVDFILEQLKIHETGTVTILACAPLTNIALAMRKDQNTMMKAKQIIVMGGCTEAIEAVKVPYKKGNITHHAEFNFQQAAKDAKRVMEQRDIPIVLMPMNCTHQLTYTWKRSIALMDAYAANFELGQLINSLTSIAIETDFDKFRSSPVMHDVHVALYLLYPEQYKMMRGKIIVDSKDGVEGADSITGRTTFIRNTNSNVNVAVEIKDPKKLFEIVLQSLLKVIPPDQARSLS